MSMPIARSKRVACGALDGVDVPPDRPIVTVCNRGKVSQIAAEQLQARGMPALSLEGGMQAWSLAWNTAEVPLSLQDARVLQVRRTGKGCLSYLLGSGDSAAVIDASLEPSVYLRLADGQGWRIRYVLMTPTCMLTTCRDRECWRNRSCNLADACTGPPTV